MVNKRFSKFILGGVTLLFLFLIAQPSYAVITQPTVFLSSDRNGDGVAGIGDVLSISCLSTTTDTTGQYPDVQCEGLGLSMTLGQLAGTKYSALLTISAGSVDASDGNLGQQVTFEFTDDGTTTPLSRTIRVDNKAPASRVGPINDTTQSKGIDSTYIVGDNIIINLELDFDDDDVVYADLSGIGLSTNYPFTGTTSATGYRLTRKVPVGKEGSAVLIPVTAIDNAGNAKTWKQIAIDIDTIVPQINSVTVANMTAGKSYVTVGDTLRIQAVIGNYDNDTVVASNSHLFGDQPVVMEKISSVAGGMAIFEYTHPVTERDIDLISTRFEITATDDAGNVTKKTSNYFNLDTLEPFFEALQIEILAPQKSELANTAIIGDVVRVYGNVGKTAANEVMKDVTLTIDLSGIGGASNQIVPFRDFSTSPNVATSAFELLYTIINYTSENNVPRAFVVTAKDKANNTLTQVTMPVHYVDNYAPTISGGQVINVTTSNKPVKNGDQIAISAVVGNIDGGFVTANLSEIGGSASETMMLSANDTYVLNHYVTSDASGKGIDAVKSFAITVVDDAGNKKSTFTNTISIDTEAPVIENATYTVTPALNPLNHPYVRIGDRITFRVQLASSAAMIHDGETVSIDMTPLGGDADVQMSYGGGWYSYSKVVEAGDLNFDEDFRVVAVDNAGNAVYRNITVPIDNRGPVVGTMGVNFLTNKTSADFVNIGDVLEFIVPVDDADFGSCHMDLSMIGSSSAIVLPYTSYDVTRKRYYVTQECNAASMANQSYVFTAIVYDKAGNAMNSLSQTFKVDCVAPTFRDSFVQITNSTTRKATIGGAKYDMAVVGTTLTFTVEVDTSHTDYTVPFINLSKVGGSSRQAMNDTGDGVFSYSHVVTEGTTNGELMKFKVTVADNAGNESYLYNENQIFVDNYPIEITSLSYVHSADDNSNGIVNLGARSATEVISATDTVTLTVEYSAVGTISVDLTKFGYNGYEEMVETNTNVQSVSVLETPTGYRAEMVFMPKKGVTNSENVYANIRAVDPNGNITTAASSNYLKVDNFPPRVQDLTITISSDNGTLGEANLNDIVQVKVTLYNHDNLEPFIDFSELYRSNGLTPPDWTIFPGSTSNTYTYSWTVRDAFGTRSPLTVIATDESGNKTVVNTSSIIFLSKVPSFKYAYAELKSDITPGADANGIINPTDTVKFTCAFNNLYTTNEDPNVPAKVLVDIRGLANTNTPAVIGGTQYEVDGDTKAVWLELTRTPASPMVYTGEYTAVAADTRNHGMDTDNASFTFVVLHPTDYTIGTARYVGSSKDGDYFPADTIKPNVVSNSYKLTINSSNDDNPTPYIVNIGDNITVESEITDFNDPASATMVLYGRDVIGNYIPFYRSYMMKKPNTSTWFATFDVATGTLNADAGDYNVWAKCDGAVLAVQIIASDDADNITEGARKAFSPTITFDNVPPAIVKAATKIEVIDNNDLGPDAPQYRWIANIADGLATDTIKISATIDGFVPNSYAYVDMSSIGGTSTYMLTTTNNIDFTTVDGTSLESGRVHYPITYDARTAEFATHTLPVYVVDAAGNRDMVADVYCRVAIDSKRPELVSARYGDENNASVLTLFFSEPIVPQSFDYSTSLRIGRTSDHKDISSGYYTEVSSLTNDLLISGNQPTSEIKIKLGTVTSGKIADWNATLLYVSIANDDSATGEDADHRPIARDRGGNWLVPVPRLTTTTVTTYADYLVRPNLISGSYNGADPDEADFIYLTFDKNIKYESISTATLNRLAVWYNRGSSNETLLNRYRLNNEFLGDTYIQADQSGVAAINTVRVRISDATKQWLAITYGNRATQMHLSVTDNKVTPLIRDDLGNRVNEILPARSIAAAFTPMTETFGLGVTHLDFSDPANPVLTISSNGRKMRIYQNGYSGSDLPRTLPADLSGVVLCSTANLSTGSYLSLGTSTQTSTKVVNWTKFKEMNTDYASTTVRIPLEPDAVKVMLTWGTKDFYLHCNGSAFKDLWGNGSEAYPDQYSNTAELLPFTQPTVGSVYENKPRVHSVAIMPISKDNTGLFKGQPAGNLYYEIAFNTADLATDVKIPIDRTVRPNMYLYRQSDWDLGSLTLKASASPIDTGAFVSWVDHNQGGLMRTAIRFTSSSSLLQDGTIDREPVMIYLDGFKDIFGNETLASDATGFNVASRTFDLSKKKDSAAYTYGFDQTASYSMELDNCKPTAVNATATNLITMQPVNVIGVLAAGNLKVTVTFSEPMNTTSNPALRLMNGTNTVMTFGRGIWKDSYTAEYTNSSAFNANTMQGLARFVVTGGTDEAGNVGGEKELSAADQVVTIKSKGPDIESMTVSTLRCTTANSVTDSVVGSYFSPMVSSVIDGDYNDLNNNVGDGIATITINFVTQPDDATGTIAIYAVNGGTPVATLMAQPSPAGSSWYAEWDGRINGNPPVEVRGATTYEVRFYDLAGNEGSSRGTIIYDTFAPRVVTPWTFPTLRKDAAGKVYANSTAKIETTLSAAEGLRMRLYGSSVGYQLYSMSNSVGTVFSLNFEGKDNNGTPLADGEYFLSVVDMAGNLGVMTTNTTEISSATYVIDKVAPVITDIKMYRKGKNLTLDEDDSFAVTSFNSNRNYIYFSISESGATIADGTGYVKVMSGSTLLKELTIKERPAADVNGTKLYAIWDGKDSGGNLVNDGTYRIVVCDLAGNEATYSDNNNVSVVKSVFKLESAAQLGTRGLRLAFSHDISPTQVLTPVSSYFGITGLAFDSAAIDPNNSKAIVATFSANFTAAMHNNEYLVTIIPDSIMTAEGDTIGAGYNTGRFTVDAMGPQLVGAPTYDGVTSQRELNLVFDEQVVFALNVTSSPSLNPLNYVFTTSDGSIMVVDSVAKGADVKTVKLTVSSDLSDSVTYTVTASNITDSFGNKGSSTISFVGRDVTAPNITLSAFSNPANEFDITILLGSDEALGGDPLVTVAQSGSTAVSTTLKLVTSTAVGTYKYIYSGGTHLNSSFSGVATIKAVASDANGNEAVRTIYFTTAFVNSSVRASVISHDEKMVAVFEPGVLKADSMVLLMPESLESAHANEVTASRKMSLRGSVTAQSESVDRAVEELVPVASYAYNLVVPAGRLAKSISMSLKEMPKDAAVGLYCDEGNGWKPVSYSLVEGVMNFEGKGAIYALLRDSMPPRAALVNDLKTAPIRETRPMFVWKVDEFGSGVDANTAEVILDGKRYAAMVDKEGGTVKFIPETAMANGDHEIALRLGDKAGNTMVSESVRFDVIGSLTIHQIVQFPNPARNNVRIRFTTNDNTLGVDDVRIRIYDTAGHLVANERNIDMTGAAKARLGMFDYECRWDLTNRKGKKVANGVYFAKIEVKDPFDPSKKAKYTQKIAVLK